MGLLVQRLKVRKQEETQGLRCWPKRMGEKSQLDQAVTTVGQSERKRFLWIVGEEKEQEKEDG